MRNLRLALVVFAFAAGFWFWRGSIPRLWPGTRRPVNVLLISIDTLRADHLGAYGFAAARKRLDAGRRSR